MAPTTLIVKPSLQEAGIGNAGAAEATSAKKRQKFGETTLYKVSNNRSSPQRTRAIRAAVRAAREESRDVAAGSPSPAAVLSQYESSDEEGGDEEGGPNADRVNKNDAEFVDEESIAERGATTMIAAEDATEGDGEEDSRRGLRHGMARLEAAMSVPTSTAGRFAERARASRATFDEAAAEHARVCRAIVEDQAGACDAALGPSSADRAYLAMLNAEGVFSVMHGLQWWAEAPGGTRNQRGHMVAFEGEVRSGTGVPNLWRFDEPKEQLFRLLTLPPVLLSETANFYANPANGGYYCATVVPDAGGPDWAPTCGRLIPIPIEWAPMFLDYPDLGTAFCRLVDLINSVGEAKKNNFTYLARSMAYACLSASEDEFPISTMSSKWKRLVMSRVTKAWATRAWMGQPPTEEAEADEPPAATSNDFFRVFGGPATRTAVTIPTDCPPTGQTRVPMPPRVGERSQMGREAQTVEGTTDTGTPDIMMIIRTMMEAQSAANVAMSVASNNNMIAFHTATAQALAAKNGDKDSKLTVAKKKILQACCGQADNESFTTPAVYLDMDVEGGTTDALGRILRRRMKTIVGSPHKSNIYVTPQLVTTIKSMSFAANGDKTHAGCTKGITPFGTPWRSVEAMNEDTAEEGYFANSTLKSPADLRKHATSAKVELPRDHLGLVRVLNNYTRLLEVLFGDECDHLAHVRAIRDGLEDNETDLESKITPSLGLHLLWRIHHDARQFFTACESWDDGEILPRSQLGLTVRHLADDCAIQLMLTCPVAAFMGADAEARGGKAGTTARGRIPAGSIKPSINPAIPPLCLKSVEKFTRLYPTLSVLDMVKKGGLKFGDVQIGGRGDCSNFNLLGKCTDPACTYNHKPAKVGEDRQMAVARKIDQALATMKGSTPAPPSTKGVSPA